MALRAVAAALLVTALLATALAENDWPLFWQRISNLGLCAACVCAGGRGGSGLWTPRLSARGVACRQPVLSQHHEHQHNSR